MWKGKLKPLLIKEGETQMGCNTLRLQQGVHQIDSATFLINPLHKYVELLSNLPWEEKQIITASWWWRKYTYGERVSCFFLWAIMYRTPIIFRVWKLCCRAPLGTENLLSFLSKTAKQNELELWILLRKSKYQYKSKRCTTPT